jgi:hypothetical protein
MKARGADGKHSRILKALKGSTALGKAKRRVLLAEGLEGLPEPVYLIGHRGALVGSNRAGARLMEALPQEGQHGSVGRRELSELFARAAERELGPAPLRVETLDGPRYFEIRFAPSSGGALKTAVLSDITVWKRALAEKEDLLRAIRNDQERPIAVCARCGAIKSSTGEWGSAGGLATSGIPKERLSHGLCPACLAEDLGHAGLGQSAIAAALAQQSRS